MSERERVLGHLLRSGYSPDDLAETFGVPVAQVAAVDGQGFWTARDELRHLRDFARSRLTSPWAVLGTTLVRVVVATKPFVVLPPIIGGRASLNLFVAVVADSGDGKGASDAAATEAVNVGEIVEAHPGSGEGLAHLFARRVKEGGIEQHTKQVLLSVAEIDSLTALGERRGTTLLPEMRKAWMGEPLGFAYADANKRLHLPRHSYRLGMVAAAQPRRAGPLLDGRDAGTPQRFVWLPGLDPDAPDHTPDSPEPLKWRPPAPLAGDKHGHHVFEVWQPAGDLIVSTRRARLRGEPGALDSHALLCREKIAAALRLLHLGVSDSKVVGHLTITEEDWELAGVVMAVSSKTRDNVVAELARARSEQNRARGEAEAERAIITEDRTVDAAVQRVCRTIMRKLHREKDWTASTDLQRAVPGRDRVHFGAAVERLSEAGQIESRQTAGQGRPKVEHRARTG